MANQLKMAIVNAISILKERGWSDRRIAQELGINRETVSKYVSLRQSGSKPAKAPTGSEEIEVDNAASGRSQCEPYHKIISDKLKKGLTCQRIYQDLRDEHGFAGSYYSVRRFVKRLRDDDPVPFRRMECMPGDEAQVDFGSGAPVIRPDGTRRHPQQKVCLVRKIVVNLCCEVTMTLNPARKSLLNSLAKLVLKANIPAMIARMIMLISSGRSGRLKKKRFGQMSMTALLRFIRLSKIM